MRYLRFFCVSAERHLWVNKISFVYVLRNAEAHTFTSDANVVCQILSGKEVDTDYILYYTCSALLIIQNIQIDFNN